MSTTTKISRSRANQVWVTVRSVSCPDIFARELFRDVTEARAFAKKAAVEVEARTAAEQSRLNQFAAPTDGEAQ